MKNKNLSFAASAVLAASAMMIAGSTARAEELPQTKAHQKFSVTQGFRDSALPVLHRASTVEQNKVGSALIERLGLGKVEQSSKLGDTLHLTGKQWSLDVTADGSGVDYRDAAVEARAHSLGKPLSEEMSAPRWSRRAGPSSLPSWPPRLFSGPTSNWSHFVRTIAPKAGRT